jgi:hypothetical protein
MALLWVPEAVLSTKTVLWLITVLQAPYSLLEGTQLKSAKGGAFGLTASRP